MRSLTNPVITMYGVHLQDCESPASDAKENSSIVLRLAMFQARSMGGIGILDMIYQICSPSLVPITDFPVKIGAKTPLVVASLYAVRHLDLSCAIIIDIPKTSSHADHGRNSHKLLHEDGYQSHDLAHQLGLRFEKADDSRSRAGGTCKSTEEVEDGSQSRKSRRVLVR